MQKMFNTIYRIKVLSTQSMSIFICSTEFTSKWNVNKTLFKRTIFQFIVVDSMNFGIFCSMFDAHAQWFFSFSWSWILRLEFHFIFCKQKKKQKTSTCTYSFLFHLLLCFHIVLAVFSLYVSNTMKCNEAINLSSCWSKVINRKMHNA